MTIVSKTTASPQKATVRSRRCYEVMSKCAPSRPESVSSQRFKLYSSLVNRTFGFQPIQSSRSLSREHQTHISTTTGACSSFLNKLAAALTNLNTAKERAPLDSPSSPLIRYHPVSKYPRHTVEARSFNKMLEFHARLAQRYLASSWSTSVYCPFHIFMYL